MEINNIEKYMNMSNQTWNLSDSLPIFCMPEFIDKMPLGLLYCLLYMILSAVVIGVLFYFYLHRLIKQKLGFGKPDGHVDDQQDTERKFGDKEILRGLLRGRPNTEMREIPVLNGDKSRSGL
jgi:hypothetical protein